MATRPAVPNVAKHQLMWLTDAGNHWAVTTLWVEHSGAITQAMIDADRAVIRAWATGYWRSMADDNWILMRIKSWNFGVTPPAKFADDVLYPATVIRGVISGQNKLPEQCAVVISLRTGAAGTLTKPPHGRIYHVGTHSEVVGERGTITGANLTNHRVAYEQLDAAFTFAGNIGRWVIISFWDGGSRAAPNLRPAPLVLPVDHMQIPEKLGTVQTRRPRQGAYNLN